MSVIFARPQARPDTVFSLARLVGETGSIELDECRAWMLPRLGTGSTSNAGFDAAVDCASAFGFISSDSGVLSPLGSTPITYGSFLDACYQSMTRPEHKDSALLRVYASVLVRSEFQEDGYQWLNVDVATLVSRVKSCLPEGSRTFNNSSVAPWRHWMEAMGLGHQIAMTLRDSRFFPRPTRRLALEFERLRTGQEVLEVSSDAFQKFIGSNFPYLDGGTFWNDASGGKALPGRVSCTLSEALLELDRTHRIELRHEGGDRRRLIRLKTWSGDESLYTSIRLKETP